MDSGLSDISKLTQRHLGFLVTKYDFRYDEKTNAFDNGYVRFRIEQWDTLEPSIEVWLKSEPKYTRIDLSWIIDEYIDHKAIDKFLFEDRLAYYAKIMREHAQQLFYDVETLLLHGIKKRLISALKVTPPITKNNYPTYIPSDLSKYFHYIKTKDPKWNPGSEL
jgi:hypothetical protein